MMIGVRAHDYGEGGIQWLAQELNKYSVNCVQLAPAKSFPFIMPLPKQLSEAFANEVRITLNNVNTQISVLGCYINPVHPDPCEREESLLRFEEHLRFANRFGCSIVGTETGSVDPTCRFHTDNQTDETLAALIESIKRLAKTAEKCETYIGIEGVAYHHVINTHEKMVTLLEEVESEFVKVIYDPVNFYPEMMQNSQKTYIDDAFDKFGSQIIAVHCKDYINKQGVKTGELVSGTGVMDHEYLLKKLIDANLDVPLILECTNQSNIERTMEYMHKCLQRASYT